jgi:hypothetical protein
MDEVNAKFENVDAVALDALEEVLLTPLESVYDLEKHVSQLTRYIMISNNSGFPIEEYRQARIFRKSVQGQFQISRTLETFDDANPNPKRHTFTLITKWVKDKLPPILSAAGKPKALHVGGEARDQLAPPSKEDLQTQLTALSTRVAQLQRDRKRGAPRNDSRQRNRNQKRGKSDTDQSRNPPQSSTITKEECEFYCHVYGSQNSHPSKECKVMLNQKERFTNAMRHATNSNNPPGGSTAIQGQLGTARNNKAVQFVQANMMRPATDPDDSHASSTANNGHASSSAAAAREAIGHCIPRSHPLQSGRRSRGEMAATTSKDPSQSLSVGAMHVRLLLMSLRRLTTTLTYTAGTSRLHLLPQPSPCPPPCRR